MIIFIKERKMHKVMIHPADYDNCREAVDLAFERFSLDFKEKKILIKPNALATSKPEEGIVTHYKVLRAVVEKLEELNPAEIIVGDNSGGRSYGTNEETFAKTGLMQGAKGYYRNIGTRATEVEVKSNYAKRLSVSSAVLEADIYISLPKFKTHGLTIVTGAIKNNYGILPGAQKMNGHRNSGNPPNFNEFVVDVFGIRPPDLIIVDAVVGMEGNGPASTELRDIGRIIASDNAVAVDAVIARMMGIDPDDLIFLRTAKERGYGDYSKDKIEIIGELTPVPDFKLPPFLGKNESFGPPNVQEMMRRQSLLRPKPDEELCTGCGTCVENCPVSALTLIEGLPVVDKDKCIICFCCQETCPEKAMQLR
jgi:uncharacterized protein (DUF362 family)/NAD-dependent dihydropyrimidine dehydrogenase PreA subunit